VSILPEDPYGAAPGEAVLKTELPSQAQEGLHTPPHEGGGVSGEKILQKREDVLHQRADSPHTFPGKTEETSVPKPHDPYIHEKAESVPFRGHVPGGIQITGHALHEIP
jgi:hypothetical protein